MKIAIMQPYFLPYIGYFQLISSADIFVVYDNVKYTKKGWINRNRFLQGGKDAEFSIALKHDSDMLQIRERSVSPDFNTTKLIHQVREAYRKAPEFETSFDVFRSIVLHEDTNLFNFIYNAISKMCSLLEIRTTIVVSSTIEIDHSLRGQEKVLAICRHLGADTYINAIGGQELYRAGDFKRNGIDLRFLKSHLIEYRQFNFPFVPWLSILDVLMFNTREEIQSFLPRFDLISGKD
jgi:hypothetical protein